MPDTPFREPPDGVSLREYVDSGMAEIRRAVDIAAEDQGTQSVSVKEFIVAILDEQRRGMVVAEQEREKAASALRVELDRAIREGDERLREHIQTQFKQVEAALKSANELEVTRVTALRDQLAGIHREVELVNQLSEKAITKAEMATEKRFESVNEFRAQLSSQTEEFLRRETFDTTVNAWSQWREGVERRLNEKAGADLTEARHEDRAQPWQIWVMGALVTAAVVGANAIFA